MQVIYFVALLQISGDLVLEEPALPYVCLHLLIPFTDGLEQGYLSHSVFVLAHLLVSTLDKVGDRLLVWFFSLLLILLAPSLHLAWVKSIRCLRNVHQCQLWISSQSQLVGRQPSRLKICANKLLVDLSSRGMILSCVLDVTRCFCVRNDSTSSTSSAHIAQGPEEPHKSLPALSRQVQGASDGSKMASVN